MSYSTEEKIVITISKDGSKVQMDAQGFSGGECSVALHRLGEALGQVTTFDHKPEYYDKETDEEVVITTS